MTYDYKCDCCNHEDEVNQPVNGDKTIVCPACGQNEYKRQFSIPGIHFKGRGFYVNDNSKEKPVIG
jgi:putative FmdB family regulatory protein